MGSDWALQMHARRHEHGLTTERPLFALLRPPTGPTSLDVDFHQGLELGIVLEGEMFRQFADYSYTAKTGDVWLCAMWEPHGWAMPTADVKSLVLVFLPEFLGDENFSGTSWLSLFAVPPQERPRVCSDRIRAKVLAVACDLAEEVMEKPTDWMTSVRLGLLRILQLLRRSWIPKTLSQGTRELKTLDLSSIIPALELFQTNRPQAMKVSEAARACGLSASRFTQVFQHALGMTFTQFQLRSRLGFVAQKLLTTNMPLEAIAAEAGFVDASHLTHAFTKHYICTPGKYRQQALKK